MYNEIFCQFHGLEPWKINIWQQKPLFLELIIYCTSELLTRVKTKFSIWIETTAHHGWVENYTSQKILLAVGHLTQEETLSPCWLSVSNFHLNYENWQNLTPKIWHRNIHLWHSNLRCVTNTIYWQTERVLQEYWMIEILDILDILIFIFHIIMICFWVTIPSNKARFTEMNEC